MCTPTEALQSTAALCTDILAQAAQTAAGATGGKEVMGDIEVMGEKIGGNFPAGAITFATVERSSGCLLLGRLDAGGVYVVGLPVAAEVSALLASWHAASAEGKALLQVSIIYILEMRIYSSSWLGCTWTLDGSL